MSALTGGTKRLWAWAAGGAAAIAGGLALMFSLLVSPPSEKGALARAPRPAIELADRREKSALDDEATLFDPTPLFQPTQWNTAQLKVERPEPNGSFQSFRVAPKFDFADSDLRLGRTETLTEGPGKVAAPVKLRMSLDLPTPVSVPAAAADALEVAMPGALAEGFGRIDEPTVALAGHGALVDIVATGTGQIALPPQVMAQIQSLAATAKPPNGREWHALEFIAAVGAAGLAAPLTITTRSGVDDVDAYFQSFLARTLRVGERLSPGFYRISVGP